MNYLYKLFIHANPLKKLLFFYFPTLINATRIDPISRYVQNIDIFNLVCLATNWPKDWGIEKKCKNYSNASRRGEAEARRRRKEKWRCGSWGRWKRNVVNKICPRPSKYSKGTALACPFSSRFSRLLRRVRAQTWRQVTRTDGTHKREKWPAAEGLALDLPAISLGFSVTTHPLHLSFPSFLVEAVARATTREEPSWFVKFKTISKILLNLFFFREIWIESEELRLINGDVCCRVYYVDKIKQLSYI